MVRTMIKRLRPFRAPILALVCVTAVCLSVFAGFAAMTKTVTIVDGDQRKTVYTLSGDVDAILEKAGVTVSSDDAVTFTGFRKGSGEVTLQRAFEIQVDAYGKVQTLKVSGGSVRDALAKAGVVPGEEDLLNYEQEQLLEPGMIVAVSDVDYATVTKEVAVAHETNVKYSSSLENGAVQVSDGKNGVMLVTYRQKLINGKVVETSLVEQKIIKQPVAETKVVGTKTAAAASTSQPKQTAVTNSSGVKCVSTLKPSKPIELDNKGRPVSYKKLITGKATAYTHTGNNTATGKKPQPGYIAVNPKQIPYGTKLYIKSTDGTCIYGYAVAADTGGFVNGGRITADLFFDTYAECIRFGVRDIEIYVLE